MIRQVLLFARGRQGDFERLSLLPLVKEVEKLVRETFPKNIRVESYLPPDLWPIRGNTTQLHQVLLNLCVNARDAMPGGGRLSFAADNVTLSQAEAHSLAAAASGDYVSLLVSDTGAGMPAEIKARIFEPFFTTKAEGTGTGIGLATVLRIVKNHSGFVKVESESGQGTTFEILLPRAGEENVPTIQSELGNLPRGNGESVLIVDDEQAIRDLVAGALQGQGYRVSTAADAHEGLQLLSKRDSDVRLLITDSEMPGMRGEEAIVTACSQHPGLQAILASGEAELSPALRERGVLLLRKPFALSELMRTVAAALEARGSSASNKLGNGS